MTDTFDKFPKPAQQIMIAAERLIAERGPDGVSMREILREAHQGNNSAIYHYFGSKEELIQTIYDLRQGEVDLKRQARLRKFGQPAAGDAASILALLLLPVVEAFEGKQREIFARFILHLLLQEPHSPLFMADREPAATHALNEKLRHCFPNLPDELYRFRYSLCVAQFLHALIQRERLLVSHRDFCVTNPKFWDELLQSVVVLFAQPFPPLHHPGWHVDSEPEALPEKKTPLAKTPRRKKA